MFKISNGNDEIMKIAQKYSHDLILLDFNATWCGPCRALAPKLHEFVEEINSTGGKKIIMCMVDVDENDDASTLYEIKAMPTLVWIKNMKVVDRVEGANFNKIKEITLKNL